MKTVMLTLWMLAGIATTNQTYAQTKGDIILGEWLSPKKDSRFLIFKKGEKYYGKILWGEGPDSKDSKNPDPKLRGRNLVGLTILNDFVFSGDNTWENGTIYDPREGKTYSCKMSLRSSDQLNVRGYVGISMFGRTEIWTR